MSSSFGRKKPAGRESGHVQAQALLSREKADDGGAREIVQAFYRITHTGPSRLERARMMREQYGLSA